MWLVGALSSIGSSPTHLAVRHSPVASAHFVPVCSSWLSYSPFPPGSFSSSLPLPTFVQKNEPHPEWLIRLQNILVYARLSTYRKAKQKLMLIYEYKVDASQKQYAAIDEAIRI